MWLTKSSPNGGFSRKNDREKTVNDNFKTAALQIKTPNYGQIIWRLLKATATILTYFK